MLKAARWVNGNMSRFLGIIAPVNVVAGVICRYWLGLDHSALWYGAAIAVFFVLNTVLAALLGGVSLLVSKAKLGVQPSRPIR